jgi:1,4-alpha-glucan branching enzyme
MIFIKFLDGRKNMEMRETVKKLKESVGVAMRKEIFTIDLFSKKIKVKVQELEFTCYAPKATKVCLAGKFNDWNPKSLPMRKNKDGYWRVSLKLSPGRHEYKYFIDGAWAPDMAGADRVLNSFGTYNNVIGVA